MSDIPSSVGKEGVTFSPFPGLRPFTPEESKLFFGREGQSRSVLDSLEKNRFVAVIGASGSGKSSLIYCGVVPELQKQASKKWTIVTTRPGSDPLRNLVDSFSASFTGKFKDADTEILRDQDIGLQEWIKGKKLGDQPILIIVDQFEEIFRFTGTGAADEQLNQIKRFVDLIYSGSSSEIIPVYVVLTMRSDFIGECSIFQNLTELINKSNYLIPQMTRDDFKKAIKGPVGIGGATIDEDLVDQLLDEVGIDTDQLPVLQHALMRTWEHWKLQNDPDKPISIGDYEAIGRMEKALSDHANEAFDELNESQRVICQNLFKILTEKGGDNRGLRRPNRVQKVAEIAKCSVKDIIEIAELFRTRGRTFLTPYQPVEITEETVIDISHESLMRIWDRLRLWVDEEASSVQMYNRLSEASELYQEGRTGLWRPPDLQLALNWREKQKPSATWGVQYNPAFERSMVYLSTSDTEFKKEEENKIRLQKRRLKITRSFALVLGAIAVFAMGLFLYSQVLKKEAEASAKDAKVQTEIAIEQRKEADKQKVAAQESADIATQQKLIAEDATAAAEVSKEEALVQLGRADSEAERALRSAQEAKKQERLAKANEQLANDQTLAANIAKDEATKSQILSIAKSMAVKSLQIDDDPDLQALLAFQAYKFNLKFEGWSHDADIYAGLYSARKTLLGNEYNMYKGHTQSINSLVFHPGTDDWYTAGADGRILKWSLSDSRKSFALVSQTDLLFKSLAISKDGKWLVAGTDKGGIYIYETGKPGKEPIHLNGHEGRIRKIEFANGGDFYTIGLDKRILKWNVTGKAAQVFASSKYRFNDIAIAPDGQTVGAADRSGNIFIYSIYDPEDPIILPGSVKNPSFSLDFSGDGKYFAVGDGSGIVRLYSTETWQATISLRGSTARINDVKFSPKSNYLASAGNDSKVLMWEMKNLNNSPLVMEDNKGFVFTIGFSQDEKFLISGDEANELIVRPVRSDLLIEGFCSMIKRNLTQVEWEVYVGVGENLKYQKTCLLLETEN